MPADKRLSAVLSATDEISESLSDIADSAETTAASFEWLDEAAESAGDALESAERSTESLGDALSGLGDDSATAAASLEAAEQAADDTGDEFQESAREATTLGAAMSALSVPALGTAAIGTNVEDPDAPDAPEREGTTVGVRTALDSASASATRTLLDTLTRDRTVNIQTDVDRDSFDLPDVGGGTLSPSASRMSPLPDGGMVDVGASLPDLSALDMPTPGSRSMAVDADVSGADELGALAGAGHAAAEGLDDAQQSAIGASAATALAASRGDEAGDSFLAAVPGVSALSSALGDARTAALGVVPGMTAAGSSVDEVGDEATQTTASLSALSASMGGASAASTGLGASLFGLHGSLSSLAIVLPGIVALGGSLAGVFGGLAVAATGLAGVVGGGLLASFMTLGEQAAARSEEATTAFEGLEIVMGNVRDMAVEALAPLRESPEFQGLAMDAIEGFINLLGTAATFAAEIAPALMPVVDTITGAFWDETPAFFTALEDTTRQLLPYLEDMMVWLAGAIPQAISWMGDEADSLASDLGDLALSGIDLAVALAEIGGTVLGLVAPAFSFVADMITPVLDAFSTLPESLQEAIIVAGGAAAAFTVLGGAAGIAAIATGALAGVLAILTSPITLTIAAVAGLLTYFDAWDDLANVLGGTLDWLGGLFGGIISSVEWAANAFLNVVDAIKPILYLIPGLGQLLLIWDNLAMVLGVVETAFNLVGDAIQWAGQQADKWLGPIDELVGAAGDLIGDALGSLGQRGPGEAQVNLGGGGGGQGQQPPPAQPQGGGGNVYDQSVNVNVGDVTAPEEGSSAARIESQVEGRLERGAGRRAQQRQRKRNYPNA